MLDLKPVRLTEKFWKHTEQHGSTMYAVLRERGVETAQLHYIPGGPRFLLAFPGVGEGEAPEFDQHLELDYACKVYDCEPGVGPGDFVEPIVEPAQ